jgi:hypothetical protein
MSLKDRIPARMSYKFLLCFLTAAFMVSTAAQLFGQLEAGKISGTVRDTSGAVIPDATVTGKSVATGAERSVQSGSIGQYLIPSLHHNYYVNPADLLYSGPNSTGAYPTTPLSVAEEKGGLGTLATGGNHDERRFGQFSLRVSF